MSNIRQLHPGKNFHITVSITKGPMLVIRFADGWEYPLELTREQCLEFAQMLLTAATDEN